MSAMPLDAFRAVVIGATGLVGSQIVKQLTGDARCREIVVLGRRASGVVSPKLHEHVIDFDTPESWSELVRGDVLFSALGTTLKAAGSKEAQYRVDYTYQHVTAVAAARNEVSTCVLVSSASADPGSMMFYSRIKGELERDVRALGFRRLAILQPGILAGERTERRTGEEVANAIAKFVPSWRALDAIRPYPAATVARACIRAALETEPGAHVYALGKILSLGDEKGS